MAVILEKQALCSVDLAMLFPKLSKLLHSRHFKTLPADDYISRLRCSVIGEGMLHPGNVYLLDYAIQHMPEGGSVVEIGAYGGLSTNLITYLLDKHRRPAPFLGCDAWVYEGYHDQASVQSNTIDGREDVLRQDYTVYLKTAFIQATRLLSSHRLPYTCHLRSDDFFALWQENNDTTDVFDRKVQLGGPIALAYIDGNHAYDFARRDFENVARQLLPGGYILLDDSAACQQFGSAQLAREVQQGSEFQVVLRNPNYLFWKKTDRS